MNGDIRITIDITPYNWMAAIDPRIFQHMIGLGLLTVVRIHTLKVSRTRLEIEAMLPTDALASVEEWSRKVREDVNVMHETARRAVEG